MDHLLTCQFSFLPGMDWSDPSDPTVIAENELLSAANSIEAAAKKLSSLQPRHVVSGPRVGTASFHSTSSFPSQLVEYGVHTLAAVMV